MFTMFTLFTTSRETARSGRQTTDALPTSRLSTYFFPTS
jgi:hypothetical protein